MPKITLDDLGSLSNETTAIDTINDNNGIIEDWTDTVFSLDGSTPNTIATDIDMDSFRILNLPDATTAKEPVTKKQLDAAANATLTTSDATITNYTASGTGAEERTLQARLDDWVNVKDFGAVGDGSTDDTTKIQKAIDKWKTYISAVSDTEEWGAILVFPRGRYKITASLDFTGVRSRGAQVYFEGSTIMAECTGKVAVDFSNSNHCTVYNLQIAGHATNTPTVGLLHGRNSGGGNAGNHTFYNTRIMGYFSQAGKYNYASEVNVFSGIQIWNYHTSETSYCDVIHRANGLSVTSDYETLGTSEGSTNDNFYENVDYRKRGGGLNMLIDGAANVNMNGYMTYSLTFASARTGHIQITTDTSVRSTELHFDIHTESPSVTCNSIVDYKYTTNTHHLYGLFIRDFDTDAESFLRFDGTAPGVAGLRMEGLMTTTQKAFSVGSAGTHSVRQAHIINYSVVAQANAIDLSVIDNFNGYIQTFDPDDVVQAGTNTVATVVTDSGVVQIGDSTFILPTSSTPQDNGDMVIEATNNTTLTFKLKGSDGTVRSGTITLS